jgi:hypothetical protein
MRIFFFIRAELTIAQANTSARIYEFQTASSQYNQYLTNTIVCIEFWKLWTLIIYWMFIVFFQLS